MTKADPRKGNPMNTFLLKTGLYSAWFVLSYLATNGLLAMLRIEYSFLVWFVAGLPVAAILGCFAWLAAKDWERAMGRDK